jgi:molecular chaperone GrpE
MNNPQNNPQTESNPEPQEPSMSATEPNENSSASNPVDVTADVAGLESRLAEMQDRLLRCQADMDNFRRRTQRDQEDARRFESLRLIRDLLPGLDGLQRAVTSAEQTGDFKNLLDGIRMVAQQFRDVLKGHAAEPIDAQGKPFNPNEHEALTQIPSADCEPMTVLQVVEMGYRMHDRVVRPARVIVSCAPPEPAAGT